MWSKTNETPKKKKPGRCFDVRVTTMDAELEFSLDVNMKKMLKKLVF